MRQSGSDDSKESILIAQAKFFPGQIVEHNLNQYRGVIFEVDALFSLSDGWYEQVARSRPPKEKPWYHVLVDEAQHTTYVAERHLRLSERLEAIKHPQLNDYFTTFTNGLYIPKHLHM